jgi:hypothetical protein
LDDAIVHVERLIGNAGKSDKLLEQRAFFAREYRMSSALYYQGQPDFDQVLARIGKHLRSM